MLIPLQVYLVNVCRQKGAHGMLDNSPLSDFVAFRMAVGPPVCLSGNRLGPPKGRQRVAVPGIPRFLVTTLQKQIPIINPDPKLISPKNPH